MGDERTGLLQGTLDMLVLKALSSGPLHGYAVARRIQQHSSDALKVEEGSLYPALHRLERRGFIESEWGVSDANRRAKYYRITAAGKRELKASTAEWKKLSDAIAQILSARPEGA
jgi:PadR family transcriptional regulator PadR